MTVLGALISWSVVAGLFWLAAMCLVASVVAADPIYFLFTILFGVLALSLGAGLVREGGR